MLLPACGRKGAPLPPLTVVPEAISEIRAVVRSEGVYLVWSPPLKNNDGSPLDNLMGFKILRSETLPAGECKNCVEIFEPINDILYTIPQDSEGKMEGDVFIAFDNKLKYGYKYRYKILSYTTTGYLSPDSKIVEILYDIPPSVPENVSGVSGDRFVQLNWNKPVALVDGQPLIGLAGYNIYRSRNSGNFGLFPVNNEPVTGNYFIDTGLENNTKYFYSIRSVRKVGETLIEGPPGNEIMVIPNDRVPPQPPRGLVVIPQKDGIILKWDAGTESDLLGYNVYRKENGEKKWKRLNKEILKEPNFKDNSVMKGIIYFYYVTALDNALQPNESEPSREVKAFLR